MTGSATGNATREALSVGIAMAGMILAEIAVPQYATYVYTEEILHFIPVVIFAALSVGNFLSLWWRTEKIGPTLWLHIAGTLTLVSLLGFCFAKELGLLLVALPFVPYGAYLASLFGVSVLRVLVVGMGLGAVALYIIMGVSFQFLAPYSIAVAVGLPLLAALLRQATIRWSAFALLIFLTTFVGVNTDLFMPRLLIQDIVSGFSGAKRVMDPIFTPLIRTDLFQATDGRRLIVTNGRRFAAVETAAAIASRKDPNSLFAPSYDVPYLYRQPKKVLVIGPAEGNNIIAAMKFNAQNITAVDINPAVFTIMKGKLSEFSGGFYSDPRVTTIAAEGRHYLETSAEKFDLITLQGVQTGSHNDFRNVGKIESFLFTEEALRTLYDHLSDQGVLWIEEYVWRIGKDDSNMSLVKWLAGIAKAKLKLNSPELQVFSMGFRQAERNPKGKDRRWREGVLVSKKPLGATKEEIQSKLPSFLLPIEIPSIEEVEKFPPVVDSRPYIQQETRFIMSMRIGGAVLSIVLLCFAAFMMRGNKDVNAYKRHVDVSLFFIGIGFIVLLVAAVSPITLLLGDPQLATPVLFMTIYAFGVLGGLLALRANLKISQLSLGFVVAYLLALPWIFNLLKSVLLGSQSELFRVVVVVLLIAPVAVLAELPYIWLLSAFDGRSRARAFTVENLGTFVGIPIGIWCQLVFGQNGSMTVAAISYAIAFIALMRSRTLQSEPALAT